MLSSIVPFIVFLHAALVNGYGAPKHRRLSIPLSADNVHWGYFSKDLAPKLTVTSGSTVTVEMASHHACDDYDKMVKGDAGMESVFDWSKTVKAVSRRGAKGTGDGVHVLTGPIAVEGAMPGDILKVEIVDLKPRPNAEGKTYGSNAAAWWGYQARSSKVDGTPFRAGGFTGHDGNDEVVTIYELFTDGDQSYATLAYQYYWPTITDPDGTERDYIQYPGTCVPHDYEGFSSAVSNMGWTKKEPIKYMMEPYKAKIPVNMHVGCMGLAPASHSNVDSIPPMPTGGNLDDKRIGKGTTMYYPVEVEGALLSMGDAHMAQGDSELDGTGIETSITGTFKITLIKKAEFSKPWMGKLDFPLGETATTWIVHSFTQRDYLETYKDNPGDIYSHSDINSAMMNTYRTTRGFVMDAYNLNEAEANTIITQGVDFGMTQLVDGNWGVHAIVPKGIFNPVAGHQLLISNTQQADLPLSSENVHWGYFSKDLAPKLTVTSGSTVTVEMASHHACDDYDKMVKGDAGMESVFDWSKTVKAVSRRGAKGTGDGVHVLTGPIAVEGAMPGDILKVEIVDLKPRPNAEGKTYGSNAAAWWGYQARSSKVDGTPFRAGGFTGHDGNDEVVTIYELFTDGDQSYATLAYQYYWPTITDPDGTERDYIQYPGTCVPHDYEGFSSAVSNMGWTKKEPIKYMMEPYKAKIPVNMHVGCMGLAPASHSNVDSIPPMPTGGNLDDKRIGKGTTMYYPVEVEGALLSMGDAHMAQGDSELDGTGIETSITGTFKITLIKKAEFSKPWMGKLDFPLGETATTWIVHSFTQRDYLETYKDNPGDIYSHSDINSAMMNTYRTTRGFVMDAYNLNEAEANTIITQGVDFGMTQLVDGNWGVHAIVPKGIFNPVA